MSKTPNTACTGQVGLGAIFKHFSGFEFSLLPSRVHFATYGWKSDLSDEEILEKLLALNLERSKS